MRIAIFGTKSYDHAALTQANATFGHDLQFFEARLTSQTTALATGFTGVCAFVNDDLSANVLTALAAGGTRLVAMRCAGTNNVDLAAAEAAGLTVVRVPEYSPYAVAEHAVAMMLTLNRNTSRASARVREGNFSIEGLVGFDMHGKTAGVVGTGKIGTALVRILLGFGCRVLTFDPYPSAECAALGARAVSLPELLSESDVISLHCPLTPRSRHLINAESLAMMKPGVMLINTGRGGLVDTKAAVEALKSRRLGYLGLDVYENEAGVFFEDQSSTGVDDDVLARLLTFPNVLVTGHQAFLTREALSNIAETTLTSVTEFEQGQPCRHRVRS